MSLIEELKAERRLFAECLCCGEEFRLANAQLFDATLRLPEVAIEHIKQKRLELVAQRADLKRRRIQASTGAAVTARAVNIGKSVEKIAPSLPGFPFRSEDCRCLLEPIDYVVFQGLSERGNIDWLQFVDLKTGGARLTGIQRDVRAAVETGNVSFEILKPTGEVNDNG